MIPQKDYLKSRRGQVLTEQAFLIAAIVGIVLVVIARMGVETTSVFDQLSRTFPRLSKSGSGRQPAGKRPKRAPSSPTAMAAATATPAAPSAAAASKTSGMKGARSKRGSGGGGIGTAKRKAGDKQRGSVSWGVTSTSSTSGSLAVLIGR
jgi:hypothetical protein